MPEGFAGFQTQLSETSNKQRREGAPLLEAYLDSNGRMAFRFVGEGGEPIAQPKVTTPGFVPSSLGGTSPDSTAQKSSITPQASQVLTDPFKEGQGAGDSNSLGGPPQLQNAPASKTALGAIGMVPGFGLATGFTAAMQKLGFRGVTGGVSTPRFNTPEQKTMFDEIVRLGDIGRTGFVNQTVSDPTGRISSALADDTSAGEPEFSTALSIQDLDTMTPLGGSAGDFEGVSFDGGDRDGGGDLGRGESPTGGDTAGTPF